jgi:molybdopterin molybdotransferase
MRFSNIFQKPGKPTILGTLNGRMVFGLPGNPSATMLSFTQFIRPVIFKMMGHRTGSKAACSQSNYFAFIDSFNYRQGGNPGHQRASQVPLSGTLSENDGHRPKQIPPGKLKADCQKVVAH